MIPVKTDDCNYRYYVDPRTGKGGLDCYLELERLTSFWMVEHDDDLAAAEGIYVEYTYMRPQTDLGLGRSLAEADMKRYPYLTEDRPQLGLALTDEVRSYLLGGGRFILRTYAVPPPPVMVWPA